MLTVMALIQTATELSDRNVQDIDPAMQATQDPSLLGAVFNRVVDRSQKGIEYARGGYDLDAVAQFFFQDISSSMSCASTGGFNMAMGLPGPLVADMQPIVCLQNTVIEPPEPGVGLKRMSILRKHPEISAEEFQKQWFEWHAPLVKRLTGCTGYRQNLVLDGPRDVEGHMLVDGMVELWFPDTETIEANFGSSAGTTLMTHAKEFISEISTFLVEPHHVSGRF